MVSICTAAFLFMLPWQFAQFALLTQTACIFAVYVLEYIGSHKVIWFFLYSFVSTLNFTIFNVYWVLSLNLSILGHISLVCYFSNRFGLSSFYGFIKQPLTDYYSE